MRNEDRIPDILSQVRRAITDEGGRLKGNEDFHDLVFKVQLDITDRAFVLKRRAELSLLPGQSLYQLDETLFRIESISTPEHWPGDLQAVHSPIEWSRVESQKFTAAHPTRCFLWNGELRLKPAPKNTDTIILYAYAHSGDVDFESGTWGELEIARDCDEALKLGIITRLTEDSKVSSGMKMYAMAGRRRILMNPHTEYEQRYEAQISFLAGKNAKEMFGPLKVYSPIDDIGF